MQLFDPEDPAHPHAIDLRWFHAHRAWVLGDVGPLGELLESFDTPLPDDARAFLAALVRGEVRRPTRSKSNQSTGKDLEIANRVYLERERFATRTRVTSKADHANEAVAKQLTQESGKLVTAGMVRGAVGRVQKGGWTFKRWKSYYAK